MKFKWIKFSYFGFVLFCLSLSSCSRLELLAGVDDTEFWSVLGTLGATAGYVDASRGYARFGNIIGIAVDAQENVYVADKSNARIRKIDPEGHVTTLAGSDKKQESFNTQDPLETQLVDLGGLTLWENTLYFTVRGCIRMIDISKPIQEMSITTFYGKCLSSEQIEPLTQFYLDRNQEPEYLRSLGQLTHDVHGNLYVSARTNQFDEMRRLYPQPEFKSFISKPSQHKITPRGQVSLVHVQSISFVEMVVDSQGCLVILEDLNTISGEFDRDWNIESDCRAEKTTNVLGLKKEEARETDFNRSELQAVWMSPQDDLYIIGSSLAKLTLDGELKRISKIPFFQEINSLDINVPETTLYFAQSTVVYKWKFKDVER